MKTNGFCAVKCGFIAVVSTLGGGEAGEILAANAQSPQAEQAQTTVVAAGQAPTAGQAPPAELAPPAESAVANDIQPVATAADPVETVPVPMAATQPAPEPTDELSLLRAQNEALKSRLDKIEAAANEAKKSAAELRAQNEALQTRLDKIEAGTQKSMATTPPTGNTPATGNTPSTGTGVTLSPTASSDQEKAKPAAKKWYDNINLRGYVQARYNRLFETNPQLRNEQGDRSWGDNGGLFLRRVRLVFSGQINKKVYFYLQPDFASSASSTSLNFGQIRDAYFDIGFDNKNEYRLRVGQSKIPFGFENLQSSQNRLPLDRSDGINSGLANERDLGAFLYWAPQKIRERFSMLVSSGLKGSGDYGVVGVGFFNGQTANKPELNNRQHRVARLTYPFLVGKKQIVETSLQHYSGKFVIPSDQISAGTRFIANRNYDDRRTAASFILYPQPFGLQAEYNWGKGPEFNPATDTIESKNLKGGYIMASYLKKIKNHTLIPFLRYHFYDGGKKHELDARSYRVREYEVGLEWQPSKQFELVAMYTLSARRFEDFVRQNNFQRGRLLRLQAQINF